MDARNPEIRPRCAPAGRGLIALLWNSNPFYPISAALVLLGLRASCDPLARSFPTWALLSGLAAYTAMLAGMAVLLVRRLGAWEDVRTIVLLVAMVLLAVPAFFDDVLARDPRMGVACELAGLAVAVAISEALLRGLALRLPAGFRVPYHLTLALFFLHPAALAPLLDRPDDPSLMWALFAFPAMAGLVTLTLLPAARKGSSYASKNGAPWRWPMYPWSLFVLMAVGVCARSFSVCLAVNTSGGSSGYEAADATIFGPYFLVPFGLAAAAVVLEAGLASRSRSAVNAALAMPIALVVVAALGHRPDAVYQRFLRLFADGVGGSPMFAALVAASAFYAVASLRRVKGAIDLLTLAVAATAVVGPGSFDADGLTSPHAAPVLAAALIQACLAIARGSTARASVAAFGLATVMAIGPVGSWGAVTRAFASIHVALAGAMLIGALGRDGLAKALRGVSALALTALTTVPLWFASEAPGSVGLEVYPVAPILAAALYGRFVGGPIFYVAAASALSCWMAVSGGRGYAALRRTVAGLDQIALGLVFFLVAALVSLAKAGALRGRMPWRRDRGLARPLADDLAG